jgi:hypothetical protein
MYHTACRCTASICYLFCSPFQIGAVPAPSAPGKHMRCVRQDVKHEKSPCRRKKNGADPAIGSALSLSFSRFLSGSQTLISRRGRSLTARDVNGGRLVLKLTLLLLHSLCKASSDERFAVRSQNNNSHTDSGGFFFSSLARSGFVIAAHSAVARRIATIGHTQRVAAGVLDSGLQAP